MRFTDRRTDFTCICRVALLLIITYRKERRKRGEGGGEVEVLSGVKNGRSLGGAMGVFCLRENWCLSSIRNGNRYSGEKKQPRTMT